MTRTSRTRRQRGIALADFITGSVILAGAVGAWASLTRAQIESAGDADRRSTARNAAVATLDRARLEGVGAVGSLSGEADKAGFRLVRAFPVAALPAANGQSGRLEARPLVVEGGASGDLFEVRVVIVWRSEHGSSDRFEVSTILAGGAR